VDRLARFFSGRFLGSAPAQHPQNPNSTRCAISAAADTHDPTTPAYDRYTAYADCWYGLSSPSASSVHTCSRDPTPVAVTVGRSPILYRTRFLYAYTYAVPLPTVRLSYSPWPNVTNVKHAPDSSSRITFLHLTAITSYISSGGHGSRRLPASLTANSDVNPLRNGGGGGSQVNWFVVKPLHRAQWTFRKTRLSWPPLGWYSKRV